jgi:hypothetical protein
MLCGLALALLSSCAANRESRLLASKLRQLTSQYNAASTEQLEIARRFYTDSAQNLEDTLNVDDPSSETPPEVQKTLGYARITTATNAAGLRLASDLVDGSGSVAFASKITAFVLEGIASADTAFREAREQQTRAVQAIAADFSAVEQHQSKLVEVSKQLADLETDASYSHRLSEIQLIGQAVYDRIKKAPGPTN